MIDTAVIKAREARIRRQSKRHRDGSAAHERALKMFLARRMKALTAVEGRTKRSAARLALLAAMREGLLPSGARLPSEKALAKMFDVSLGTAQAALRQIQQTGIIIRRRGDGTRVASIEPLSSAVWHFRFKSRETGHPLRFVRQDVAVAEVTMTGPWSDFLEGAARFVRIRRRMTMSDGSRIFAEMYLDAEAAMGLADIDTGELDSINIRPYLEEAYGITTAGARHSVSTRMLTPTEAREFALAAGRFYFEIHATAFGAGGRPIYFQRIFVDCADHVLDF